MKKVTVFIMVMFFLSSANTSETLKGAKKDIEIFKQEMTVKLHSVELEIEKIKEKAKTKGSQAEINAVKNLENTRLKIYYELDELEKAGEGNWKRLKINIAKSIVKLNARTQALLKEDK